MRPRLVPVLVLVAAACGTEPYVPGSFPGASMPNGPVRTIGCLDATFRLERDGDLRVLDMDIGNRCWRPTRIDLRALHIEATDAFGQKTPMTLSDPRHEVELLTLDIMTHGREHFHVLGGEDMANARIVCIDVARIAPDAPDAHPPPICVEAGPWIDARANR